MMNLREWSVEETDFISCYWEAGKPGEEIIKEIEQSLPYMETEMQRLAERIVKKLEKLPEKEYGEMVFCHSTVQ
jgi:hypothetical protein